MGAGLVGTEDMGVEDMDAEDMGAEDMDAEAIGEVRVTVSSCTGLMYRARRCHRLYSAATVPGTTLRSH
jgi:hypothetical protein